MLILFDFHGFDVRWHIKYRKTSSYRSAVLAILSRNHIHHYAAYIYWQTNRKFERRRRSCSIAVKILQHVVHWQLIELLPLSYRLPNVKMYIGIYTWHAKCKRHLITSTFAISVWCFSGSFAHIVCVNFIYLSWKCTSCTSRMRKATGCTHWRCAAGLHM